jgi:hypothetical protein
VVNTNPGYVYYPIEFSNFALATTITLTQPGASGPTSIRIENWSTEGNIKDHFRVRAMGGSDFHTATGTILYISVGY